MASIHDILRPITLTKVVSRIAEVSNELLNEFGVQPGGPNEQSYGHGREGSYHVFNNVRGAGLLTAPGMPAARAPLNPLGRVPFVYPRMHEQIYLLAEFINHISKIGDPGMRDQAGADFIRLQMKPIGQRLANHRLVMLAGLLRGGLYVQEVGNNWYFSFTSSGAKFQVDSFNTAAGNKSQLDMLGAGSIISTSWDNPGADIPNQLGSIDAAFQKLVGSRLETIVCPWNVWNNVTNNDFVAAKAGIASSPWEIFARNEGTNSNGKPFNSFKARIKAFPMVDWLVTNEGVDIGVPGAGTFTQMIPDTGAVFCSGAFRDSLTMYLGSEPIREYDNGPESIKVGSATWSKGSSNPTGYEVFSLDNALPINHTPDSYAFGTVIF